MAAYIWMGPELTSENGYFVDYVLDFLSLIQAATSKRI